MSYGKSNEPTSFLYDPLFTMKITLGGELSLTMLIERVALEIPESHILMSNTDGFECRIKRTSLDKYYQICSEWEELTKLKLEYAIYNKLIIRDVNNYIGIYDNGKVKLKGVFEIDRDWHKNHSMKIVPYALKQYYVNNISVEESIHNCNDIFKFCKGAKSKGNNKLELHSYQNFELIKEPLQKINRYYISSNSDKTLMKVLPPLERLTDTDKHRLKVNPNQSNLFDFMEDVRVDPDRESNVEAGYKVTILNEYVKKEINEYEINYDYYINECYKIINAIK